MAAVFLSYAEQDGHVADLIVAALRLSGITVAPAHPPQPAIGLKTVARELTLAKCVVVLWSEHSVTSKLVRAEADYAKRRDILVSAGIGKPPLPLGFRDVWFANLTHWTGEADSEMFLVLKRLVEPRLNPPTNTESSSSLSSVRRAQHLLVLPPGKHARRCWTTARPACRRLRAGARVHGR